MQLKPGNFCPLLQKECIQMECNWFIEIRGVDNSTGKEVDEYGCSIAWLPHLLIENANKTSEAGAATESFRNEYVKTSEAAIGAMIAIATNSGPETNHQALAGNQPMRIVYDQTEDNNQ